MNRFIKAIIKYYGSVLFIIVEIDAGENHAHFLIQSVLMFFIESITAKELFRFYPEGKEKLWEGSFCVIYYVFIIIPFIFSNETG